MTINEQQDLVEKIIAFRNIQRAQLKIFDELIEEVIPWTPREYSVEHEVGPGARVGTSFGSEWIVPGTMMFDLPETVQKEFGISHPFRVQHLLVDDKIAGHFDIHAITVGASYLWNVNATIPATKFSAALDQKIDLKSFITPGLTLGVVITNKSAEKQTFRARVTGTEKKSDPQTEAIG